MLALGLSFALRSSRGIYHGRWSVTCPSVSSPGGVDHRSGTSRRVSRTTFGGSHSIEPVRRKP